MGWIKLAMLPLVEGVVVVVVTSGNCVTSFVGRKKNDDDGQCRRQPIVGSFVALNFSVDGMRQGQKDIHIG